MPNELDITALFRERGAFVARSVERLVGPGPHVDDLLQETFIVAFRKGVTYAPQRSSADTWLYGIAANLCRRFERGNRRFGSMLQRYTKKDVSTLPDTPEHLLERHEQAQLVYDALQKLPFKQREVFALYELEGMEGKTIATTLKIPEGTVWTRLHHARHKFTKQLGCKTSEDR